MKQSYPDLRVNLVLTNARFNDSDWFRKGDDARWQFGLPPWGNANGQICRALLSNFCNTQPE
jgi:hypothetical protein